MDTARYARFERPGHHMTGDRSQRSRNWMSEGTRVGYDFAHAIVDDHSRLAYVELLGDEKAATVTAFVTRALVWFEAQGIRAKRLMTDNAWSYTHNNSLRKLLVNRDIKHLGTQAYRPQTNGQSRALPPDHGPRVGLRHDIPIKPPPRPSAATLARALQQQQTPLRDQEPAAHQLRSQPP
jgi:Integrase core domain